MVSHRTRYYPLAVQVLSWILTAIALIVLLFLVLMLLDANRGNPMVSFIGAIADWFSWPFRGMFSMETARLQALVDYGLATLVYLGLAGLVHGLGRRVVD